MGSLNPPTPPLGLWDGQLLDNRAAFFNLYGYYKGPGPDVKNAHEIIFRLPVFNPQYWVIHSPYIYDLTIDNDQILSSSRERIFKM